MCVANGVCLWVAWTECLVKCFKQCGINDLLNLTVFDNNWKKIRLPKFIYNVSLCCRAVDSEERKSLVWRSFWKSNSTFVSQTTLFGFSKRTHRPLGFLNAVDCWSDCAKALLYSSSPSSERGKPNRREKASTGINHPSCPAQCMPVTTQAWRALRRQR